MFANQNCCHGWFVCLFVFCFCYFCVKVILELSSVVYLGLLRGLFPWALQTKIVFVFSVLLCEIDSMSKTVRNVVPRFPLCLRFTNHDIYVLPCYVSCCLIYRACNTRWQIQINKVLSFFGQWLYVKFSDAITIFSCFWSWMMWVGSFLFNDPFPLTRLYSVDDRMVNDDDDELERIWKEAAIA
jgi:hypothetical protein